MDGKLNSVQVLRGLSALSVVIFHLTSAAPRQSLVGIVGGLGIAGVFCFFVLSGFVIPYSLQRSGHRTADFWRFMAKRMVRLEPPYIASIALVIGLGWIVSATPWFRGAQAHYELGNLAAHLLYLVPLTGGHWVNIVYWTLAYEFVFYISAGLLFASLFPRPIGWTAGLVVLVAMLLPGHSGWADGLVMLFFLGIATARYMTGRDSRTVYLTAITLGGLAIASTGSWLMAFSGVATALTVAFVRVPTIASLAWLGAISYSLYLIHVPIIARTTSLAHRLNLPEPVVFCLGLAVALAFAWIFFRLIEAPSTTLSKALASRWPRSPVAPAAASAG